ncbi:phospholipase C/P1 nuclease domain-containing protein [Russula dissimulans]|nr:phospholipase C/P1 nuclease domain-containing protein [Russula dissimulans]
MKAEVALPSTLAATLMAPISVAARSDLGHETIGYSLGPAATAHQVRYQRGFGFTRPFHFIDANDNPPSSCSVDLARDCGSGGCAVSAIQNYTSRAQQALLFITHFIGDIGQPLHDEALELGENRIAARCDGTSTNLHATWNINALYGGSPQTYASELVRRISSGGYASLAAGWVNDISQAALSGTDVPLTWAQEVNAYDCTVVFNFSQGQDLCDTSYL